MRYDNIKQNCLTLFLLHCPAQDITCIVMSVETITYTFCFSAKFIKKKTIDKFSSHLLVLRDSPTAPFSKSAFLGLWWRRVFDTRDLLLARDTLLRRRNTIRRLEKVRQSAATRAARLRLVRGRRLSGHNKDFEVSATCIFVPEVYSNLSPSQPGQTTTTQH